MADNKDFDSIMHKITRGLSGDSMTDNAYLKEQVEEYKDHELGKEIVRVCARFMYELFPDDKKKELERVINNDSSGTEATLEEVRFSIYKKDFNKALQIMEAFVTKVEALNAYEDDPISDYHDFEEWFEEILYQHRSKSEKNLLHAQIPYREMYLLYGSLLVELNRIPEAQEALKKGLRWDPICFRMMSEYIETYKMSGDLEQFYILTKEAFKIAFRSTDLARCYRNLGYYFVEKKLWSEAISCNLLSLEYDNEAKAAQSELYYINSATDAKIPDPSPNRDAVLGSKIHIISLGDTVEIEEFVILLQSCVNAQVVHGVNVLQAHHGHRGAIQTCVAIGEGAEKIVIIEILFPGGDAENALYCRHIRTGFALHVVAVKILTFPRMHRIIVGDQLFIPLKESGTVFVCPPVVHISVFIVL